jgi:indole-3-glycerol phosphate synthase
MSRITNFLHTMRARAEERAAAAARTADAWAEQARRAPPPRALAEALRGRGLAIIAEAKRQSPSAGVLVDHYDVAAIAAGYEAAGARAVSVLTEPDFFGGALDHLRAARAAVRLPVLRKDFLLHPAQVAEARAAGADAVLAIVRLLTPPELRALLDAGRAWGMEVLVEVHDERELAQALEAGATLVGVNNRDLDTFVTDVARCLALRRAIPPTVVTVAESGFKSAADLLAAQEAGYDAVLVGEQLMRAGPGLIAEAASWRS